MHQETCLDSPSAPCIPAISRRGPILQTRKLEPGEVTEAWRSPLPSENVNPGPQDSRTPAFHLAWLAGWGRGSGGKEKEGKNGFLVINGPPSDDHSFIHKALLSTCYAPATQLEPQDATTNKMTMAHCGTMGLHRVCGAMENSMAATSASNGRMACVVGKRN